MRKENRLELATTFMENNKELFSKGGTVSEAYLCKHFGIKKPQIAKAKTFKDAAKKIQKYNFAKLSAYTAVNSLARPKGAVVQQKAEEYVILVNEKTAPVINYYKNRISTLVNNLKELN